MKTKLFVFALLVVLLCGLMLPGLALSGARYPTLAGAVTDDANALSQTLVSDMAKFQSLAQADTGVVPYVVIVHFLDGLDAQTYANELFARWKLGDNDFLLLGAVGEDTYACAMGKGVKFSELNAKNLLASSGFSQLFKSQHYDEAFGKYFVAFSDMLGKQYSVNLRLGQLFSAYQTGTQATAPAATSKPNWTAFVSDMYGEFLDRFDTNAKDYEDYHQQRKEEGNGLSAGEWIILVIIIMIIVSQTDPVRKARKKGRSGCGCSPFGWIFGLLGLNALFGRKRR